MGTILQRIEQIASNERVKITAFEKSIGASKGVLSRAIANGTDIQSKWIESIVEKYPRYSETWLLTGRGPMLKDEAVPLMDEQNPPVDKSPETSVYYNMYKEERNKVESQAEQIGALKQTIRQLEEKIEGLQAGSDLGSVAVQDAGIADVG